MQALSGDSEVGIEKQIIIGLNMANMLSKMGKIHEAIEN